VGSKSKVPALEASRQVVNIYIATVAVQLVPMAFNGERQPRIKHQVPIRAGLANTEIPQSYVCLFWLTNTTFRMEERAHSRPHLDKLHSPVSLQ